MIKLSAGKFARGNEWIYTADYENFYFKDDSGDLIEIKNISYLADIKKGYPNPSTRGIGKISYNQHRWDSGGAHYQQTISVSKEWARTNVLRSDFGEVEVIDCGVFLGISQAIKLSELTGWKLKEGYNTFLRFA